jgi:hypothetical protein
MTIEANVPRQAATHRLTFENHHQSRIGVYLVNGLVPRDPSIQIAGQERSEDQSFYRLHYADKRMSVGTPSFTSWLEQLRWFDGVLLVLTIALGVLGRCRAAIFRR